MGGLQSPNYIWEENMTSHHWHVNNVTSSILDDMAYFKHAKIHTICKNEPGKDGTWDLFTKIETPQPPFQHL